MKVKCTANHLSDLYLTGFHREQLALQFSNSMQPSWEAQTGKEYTVYAISIRRGCPFYYIAGTDIHQPFTLVPAVCFEILDARMSRYWRFETRVVGHRGNSVFHTAMAFREWYEPMFLENLHDMRPAELERMRQIAYEMDCEFGRYPLEDQA